MLRNKKEIEVLSNNPKDRKQRAIAVVLQFLKENDLPLAHQVLLDEWYVCCFVVCCFALWNPQLIVHSDVGMCFLRCREVLLKMTLLWSWNKPISWYNHWICTMSINNRCKLIQTPSRKRKWMKRWYNHIYNTVSSTSTPAFHERMNWLGLISTSTGSWLLEVQMASMWIRLLVCLKMSTRAILLEFLLCQVMKNHWHWSQDQQIGNEVLAVTSFLYHASAVQIDMDGLNWTELSYYMHFLCMFAGMNVSMG